ncbi:hypothetical protein QQS21_003695 [Conoideocrella luteorostrata]|uniref:CFEM domain-containing protein n=1 Tax=Conoideocrella luteorostrata TaxID=1105319 RepID=A0AAJ0G0B8_9HYPO|nr:hypothetical protein QQS21_003695 [Conoideocrella luteorostrata]
MKLSTWFLLAGTAIVSVVANGSEPSSFLTDVVTKLPSCAATCFKKSSTQTKCLPSDASCLCADEQLLNSVTACVLRSCTAKESILAKKITSEGCHAPIRDKTNFYITISDTFGIISGLFIIQRFGFKLWAKQELGLDDWFALATIVCGVPSTIINTYGVGANGIGRDVWTLDFDKLYNFGKYFFVIEVLYFCQIALVKLAMLFFFLRIFPARNVRRLLWGAVAFVAVYAVVFVCVGIFACSPVTYFWTRWDHEHGGSCLNINAIGWSNAAIGIAIDIWIIAVPMWQLRGLNMHWKKKLGVAAMFLLGTFVTVVSILRLRSLVRFGADSVNPTWDFFEVAVWSCIEVNVGIWCTCLPSFRQLLVHLFPSLSGSIARSYARYGSSANRANDKSFQSRSLGPNATVTSQFDRGHGRSGTEGNHITYHKSYTVEISDADEVALVQLGGGELRTAASSSKGSL